MFSKSYKVGPITDRKENVQEKCFKLINEENNNGLGEKDKYTSDSNYLNNMRKDNINCTRVPQYSDNGNIKNTKKSSNPAFDDSSNSSNYLKSDTVHINSSYESLCNASGNVIYDTVLRIDEEVNHCSGAHEKDLIDGAEETFKDVDSTNDGNYSAASTNTMYEQEDTLSLLCDNDINKNGIQLKRDSKHSIYDEHTIPYHFMDAVEKRLSLTHDAGEKIVNKILDHHFEKYEEIPKDDSSKCKENSKKSKRIVKNGQILSTVRNGEVANRPRKDKCCCCCGIQAQFITGVLCVLIGILTAIWTPSEFLMRERLRMLPGLPAFDWWAKPPDDIYLRIYLFNFTNYDKFLSGKDTKLDVTEIGPVVFKEKLEHSNFTFNDNYTLTYRAHRWIEFLPEFNTHIDMNATITVPNLPMLGFASYLYDINFFVKNGFSFFIKTQGAKPFVNITIYDYLFNFTDSMLETGRRFVPQIVPIDNMGMLSTMYLNPIDTVTVYVGPTWGDENFFTIDRFNGHTQLPGFLFTPSCKETVVGSTEGILYRQKITKNTTLLYWRKTLCKVMKLNYEEEQIRNGILAYKFSIPLSAYYRTFNRSNPDCFAGDPPLPNGLSDISRCFFDFPMALSLPHFLGTDPEATKRINGLNADSELHNSYLVLEPKAGIPIVSIARSQINLVMRKMSGFTSDIQMFSDMIIPMFWAEYSQLVLPDYVWALMIAQLKYVPVIEVILSIFLVVYGIYLTYAFFKQVVYPLCCPKSFRQHKNLNNLARNAIMSYELEKRPPNSGKK